MSLTVDQIAELAPDASSAAAGKKLASGKDWQNLGRSADAVWGECRGSAVYQTRFSLHDMGYKCSCPSRKLPCKHVLGLMMINAASAGKIADAAPPGWVAEWLANREARAAKKEAKAVEQAAKPVDEKAQAKRAEQRLSKVVDGLQRLDLWIGDLVRNGLAGVESQPGSFWETQAARLVDAQAPALAGRLRRIGMIPGTGPDWPRQVLAELGKLKLLLHAFGRLDQLDPLLQADLRQLIGWNLTEAELAAHGDLVQDRWLILGQWLDDEGTLKTQRNWLYGIDSGREALIMQFSAAGQPFPELIVPGGTQSMKLAYYPSAAPQRARILSRDGQLQPWRGPLPGDTAIAPFFGRIAERLAKQPWLERFPAAMTGRPTYHDSRWYLVDAAGDVLPLQGNDYWKLLAHSGGQAVRLVGEWDGDRLRPLGVYAAEGFIAV